MLRAADPKRKGYVEREELKAILETALGWRNNTAAFNLMIARFLGVASERGDLSSCPIKYEAFFTYLGPYGVYGRPPPSCPPSPASVAATMPRGNTHAMDVGVSKLLAGKFDKASSPRAVTPKRGYGSGNPVWNSQLAGNPGRTDCGRRGTNSYPWGRASSRVIGSNRHNVEFNPTK